MTKAVDKKDSFRDYYNNLSNGNKEKLKNLICEELEYSAPSFYRKLNTNHWSPKETEKISLIIKSFHEKLSKEFITLINQLT